ncbi:DUF1289 domain-containing protein [Paraburkholderia domus]
MSSRLGRMLVQPLDILPRHILGGAPEQLLGVAHSQFKQTGFEMSDLKSAAYGAGGDPGSAGASDIKQTESSGIGAPIIAVPSPCIDICKLDVNTGLCIGCLRTRDEIRGWKHMTDDLRLQLIDDLSHRKAKLDTAKAETL